MQKGLFEKYHSLSKCCFKVIQTIASLSYLFHQLYLFMFWFQEAQITQPESSIITNHFFCGQAASKKPMSGYSIYGGVSMAEKVEVSWVLITPMGYKMRWGWWWEWWGELYELDEWIQHIRKCIYGRKGGGEVIYNNPIGLWDEVRWWWGWVVTCFFCGQAANQRWMSGYNIYGGISMAEKVEVSWVIIAPVFMVSGGFVK